MCSTMSHHNNLSMSPNYPQGSAVNFLGALAQQYQTQQQHLPQHYHQQYQQQTGQQQFQHGGQQFQQEQMYHHQQQQGQQFQQQQFQHQQQYQQNLQQHHFQQQMMIQQMQEQAMMNRSMEYGMNHQNHGQNASQGLLSPVPATNHGLQTPKTSTPRPPMNSSANASWSQKNNATPHNLTTPKQKSPAPVKKVRTNFHSIADLVGEPSEKVVEEKVVEAPVVERKTESLTEFLQRGKRKRAESDASSDSEPGLVIDESTLRRQPSPTASHGDQLTCSTGQQPILTVATPDSRVQDWIPTLPQTTSPNNNETGRESRNHSPSSEQDWRPVSPALSTVSSIRDTDTPCSVLSTDSFSSYGRDDEKSEKKDDGSKRPSKSRRIFQAPQIHILEQVFAQCQYPEPAFIEKLAKDLDTTDGKIRVWFQNKRARWRKRSHDNDQSKQSPWLPGTPLYGGQHRPGQLPVTMPTSSAPVSPVAMTTAQQQSVAMAAAAAQHQQQSAAVAMAAVSQQQQQQQQSVAHMAHHQQSAVAMATSQQQALMSQAAAQSAAMMQQRFGMMQPGYHPGQLHPHQLAYMGMH